MHKTTQAQHIRTHTHAHTHTHRQTNTYTRKHTHTDTEGGVGASLCGRTKGQHSRSGTEASVRQKLSGAGRSHLTDASVSKAKTDKGKPKKAVK